MSRSGPPATRCWMDGQPGMGPRRGGLDSGSRTRVGPELPHRLRTTGYGPQRPQRKLAGGAYGDLTDSSTSRGPSTEYGGERRRAMSNITWVRARVANHAPCALDDPDRARETPVAGNPGRGPLRALRSDAAAGGAGLEAWLKRRLPLAGRNFGCDRSTSPEGPGLARWCCVGILHELGGRGNRRSTPLRGDVGGSLFMPLFRTMRFRRSRIGCAAVPRRDFRRLEDGADDHDCHQKNASAADLGTGVPERRYGIDDEVRIEVSRGPSHGSRLRLGVKGNSCAGLIPVFRAKPDRRGTARSHGARDANGPVRDRGCPSRCLSGHGT